MTINDDPFFGTSGPRDAALMIVGESWGAEEYQQQKPFVGQSGQELTRMLQEAGLSREECFITNVAPDQPFDNDMSNFFDTNEEGTEYAHLFPKKIVLKGIENLYHQIYTVKPKLIIACGNYATWALCPEVPTFRRVNSKMVPSGIMNTPRQGYRGSHYFMDTFPVLPILHPAAIMRAWHFRSTTVHDLRTAARFLAGEFPWGEQIRNLHIKQKANDILMFLHLLHADLEKGKREIVVDIETYKEHLTCIGVAVNKDTALCIQLVDIEGQRLVPAWSEEEHIEILGALIAILRHPNCFVIGQNFLYDLQYIWRWLHVIPQVSFDTMIAQHLCFPTLPKDLNYLSSMYCTNHRFWKGESKEWSKGTELEALWFYNCKDCCATFECAQELRSVIKAFGLEKQFDFQMRQFWLAFSLMARGVRIDSKKKFEMRLQLMEKLHEIETWLERIVPEALLPRKKKAASWYNSDKQTSHLLYEVLGLKKQHHKKTGNLSVNKEALQELGNVYPFVRPVTEALALLRTTSTFIHNFLSAALDPDGRMRCSYNVGGAYSFRLSSSENAFGRGTNLQNIPKNQED